MRTPAHPRPAPQSRPPAGALHPGTAPVPYLVLVTPRWLTLKYRSLRGWESEDPELRGWQRNYRLNRVNTFSLFDEFMEMSAWAGRGLCGGAGPGAGAQGDTAPPPTPAVIQYGFTTIFVAAFPLAPLLAFFSNVVEIRLDAIKMVRLQRRLVPRKAKDIGQGAHGAAVRGGTPSLGAWAARGAEPALIPLPPRALPQVFVGGKRWGWVWGVLRPLPGGRAGLACTLQAPPAGSRIWLKGLPPTLGAQAEKLDLEDRVLREGGAQQLGRDWGQVSSAVQIGFAETGRHQG